MKLCKAIALGAVICSLPSQAEFLKVKALSDPFQGTLGGSLYYKDIANVFHNPAEMAFVNKDLLYLRNREGGYFTRKGRSMYGAYYGHESTAFSTTKNAMAITGSQLRNAPLKLLYSRASRSSAWGVSLDYQSQAEQRSNAGFGEDSFSGMKLAAGYSTKKYDVFFNYETFTGENGDTSTTAKSVDGGNTITAGYKFEGFGMRNYVTYSATGYDTVTTNTTETNSSNTIIVGTGKVIKKKGKPWSLNYSASVSITSGETTTTTSTNENSGMTIPLQIGGEYQLLSWLKVRGGGVYFLMNNSETTQTTGATTTKTSTAGASKWNPRLGAEISYQKFDINFFHSDGFGNNNDGTVTADRKTELSLTYNF